MPDWVEAPDDTTKKPLVENGTKTKKPLVDLINGLTSGFKALGEGAHALNQATVFFSMYLRWQQALVLGHSDLAKRVGLTTKQELQKQQTYLNQRPTSVQLTPKLAIQMGLLRPFNVTITPEEPGNLHPDLGRKYTTTCYYSLEVPWRGLMDDLVGTPLDIPYDFVGPSLGIPSDAHGIPPVKFRYLISEATEATGRKNTSFI